MFELFETLLGNVLSSNAKVTKAAKYKPGDRVEMESIDKFIASPIINSDGLMNVYAGKVCTIACAVLNGDGYILQEGDENEIKETRMGKWIFPADLIKGLAHN